MTLISGKFSAISRAGAGVARGSALLLSLAALAALVGCAQAPTAPIATAPAAAEAKPDLPPPAPNKSATAAPSLPPSATPPPPSLPLPAVPSASAIAVSAALTPDGKPRYACQKGGSMEQIVLPQGTDRICSRFPAMGPCQYERDACRASGGRVIRFDGVEITKDVEHEYDKQVQRFRLNAG